MGYGNMRDELSRWSSSKYATLEGYPIPQWRRGIKWYAGGAADAPFDVDPPLVKGKPVFVEETPGGDVLITMQNTDNSGVVKMSRDFNVKWRRLGTELGADLQNAAVWNYSSDKVLVSDPDNGRVFRYDPGTDTIELEISAFDQGSFSSPRGNWESHGYHQESETGRIWVADLDNHFVALFDENGNQISSFGTYGTSGSGTDLNSPHWVDRREDRAFIADEFNNRIVVADLTAGSISFLHAYPYPTHVSHGTAGKYCWTSSVASEHFRPFLWTGDGVTGIPWWTSESCLTPTRFSTFLGTYHGKVIEWDWKASPDHQVPIIWPNRTDRDVGTEAHVLPCLGWSSVKIEALSTAADTLNIYSLKTRGGLSEVPIEAKPDADGNLQWQTYASRDMTADELEIYDITSPSGVMKVEVTGSGVKDLRCHFNP